MFRAWGSALTKLCEGVCVKVRLGRLLAAARALGREQRVLGMEVAVGRLFCCRLFDGVAPVLFAVSTISFVETSINL